MCRPRHADILDASTSGGKGQEVAKPRTTWRPLLHSLQSRAALSGVLDTQIHLSGAGLSDTAPKGVRITTIPGTDAGYSRARLSSVSAQAVQAGRLCRPFLLLPPYPLLIIPSGLPACPRSFRHSSHERRARAAPSSPASPLVLRSQPCLPTSTMAPPSSGPGPRSSCGARRPRAVLAPLLVFWTTITTFLALLAATPGARAYIPAQPTNDTTVAQAAGQNFSDKSLLTIQWFGGGSHSSQISYQLVGADSTGVDKVCVFLRCRTGCNVGGGSS